MVPKSASPASLEREPWRFFRSSIAVRFTTRRRRKWSPEALEPETRGEIALGLEAHNGIKRRFSDIDSAFFDLLYDFGTPTAGFGGKVASVRELTLAAGPLSAQRTQVMRLTGQLDGIIDDLLLLVHGLLEVREERSGEIRFRFELAGRSGSWSAPDLHAIASHLESLGAAIVETARMLRATHRC